MTWFRVDDDFHHHPKVMRIPARYRNDACGVWLLCGSWAARYGTDGFVPSDVVRQFDSRERMAARLVDVGLWTEEKRDGQTGYVFHEWLERQPSNAETTARKQRNAERQRRFRERRNGLDPTPGGPGDGADTGDDQYEYDEPEPDEHDNQLTSNATRNALRNGATNATPTRPVPYPSTSRGNLGGESLELHAQTINNPHPKRPRCERHRDLPDDDPGPPCHGCRVAREIAESSTADAVAASRAQRAQARAQVDQCDACDDVGWLLGDDHTPVEPARRCTHRPLRSVS